jgi:hypothetical protein
MKKYNLNEGNEIHKRVLLMMKYDTNKTLSENTQQILIESPVTPIKKLVQSLVGLSDDVLETITTKTKPELQAILNKTRRNLADEDELFKSIKDFPSLATKLFRNSSLFTPIQQKNLVDKITDAISKDPSKYSRSSDLITDSLMMLSKFPESATPLIKEYSKLIVKNDVNQLLKIKYPKVYSQLFPKVGGIVKKLSKAEAKNLKPKTIQWWERVLSTDLTVSDLIKGLIDDTVNRAILRRRGTQQYVDDLISKLQKSVNDSLNLKRGETADITQLRNINTMIRTLEQKFKIDSDAFYDAVEDVLKTKYPGNTFEIQDLMKQVKSLNPFKTGRAGALTEFFNNTATSKYFKSLGKSIFGDEKAKNFKEFCERTLSFLIAGTPKTKAEFAEYFSKGSPGIKELWRDLNIALHVGMPISLSIMGTLFNILNMSIFGNDTEIKSWSDDFKQRLYSRYINMLNMWGAIGVVIPVHPYAINIWDSISETVQDVYKNKYSIKKMVLEHNLNGLSNDELSKFDGYDPTKSKKENIKVILNAVNPGDGYDIIEPDNDVNVAPDIDDETVPGGE